MGNKSWGLLHPHLGRRLWLYLLTVRFANSIPVMPFTKAIFYRSLMAVTSPLHLQMDQLVIWIAVTPLRLPRTVSNSWHLLTVETSKTLNLKPCWRRLMRARISPKVRKQLLLVRRELLGAQVMKSAKGSIST